MLEKVGIGLIAFGVSGFIHTGIDYLDRLECHDYTTKNAVWKGYSAKDSHEQRCFYVEQAYPWRVRQGRVD